MEKISVTIGKLFTKRVRRWLNWLGLLIGSVLFIYQIWVGVASLADYNTHSPLKLILASGLIVFAFGCQITAWLIMNRALGIKIDPLTVYQNYTISFLPKYIPGGIWGYLSRNEWMFWDFNVKYSTSNLLSILELLISIYVNLLMIGVFLVHKISANSSYLWVPLLLLLVVMGWICFQYFGKKLKEKIPTEILDFALIPLISLKYWMINSFLFFIYWLCFGVAMWILCAPEKGTLIVMLDDRIWGFTGIYCISWLIGFLVFFAPSGLGIRETSIKYSLNKYLWVPSNTAALASVILRVMSVVGEFVWILIGLLLRILRKSRLEDTHNQ